MKNGRCGQRVAPPIGLGFVMFRAMLVALAIVAVTGCDSALLNDRATDDEAPPATPGGTVTVSQTAAYSGSDTHLWAWLYARNEWNIDHPPTVLAAGRSELVGGKATVTLKTTNGASTWESFATTETNWRGTGGTTYDLYVLTSDAEGTPIAGDSARFVWYPVGVTIDGDTTMEIDDLATYSSESGMLTVTLTGAAAQSGKDFGAGVFGSFSTESGPDDEVTKAVIPIGADGTAVVNLPDAVSVRPAAYHVMLVIFLVGTPETGPQNGDLIYEVHPVPWNVNGNRHMQPTYADFVVLNVGG